MFSASRRIGALASNPFPEVSVGPNPFHWRYLSLDRRPRFCQQFHSFSRNSSVGPGRFYWIIQGIAAWIVAPMVLALLLVPHLFDILHAAPSASIYYACFWGIMWGVGGLTFGLSIRYLGIALGLCDRTRLLYRIRHT